MEDSCRSCHSCDEGLEQYCDNGFTGTYGSEYADRGLIWMSFISGFADIDPFILSLLQGKFTAGPGILLKAVVTATASNNLLKAVYAFALGGRRTGWLAGGALVAMSGLTLLVLRQVSLA